MTNCITYLKTGQGLSFERTTPTNYSILDRFDAGDNMVSRTNTLLWRGQFNPPSPFSNEYGTAIRVSAKIASAIPFNLNGIKYQLGSSDPANLLASTGGLAGSDYNLSWTGLWYGPDGIKGTADDVWRTSGPGTALVNELYYVGNSKSFACDSQSDQNIDINYVANNAPFSIKDRYTIYGTNGQFLASAFRIISTVQQLPSKIIQVSVPNGRLEYGSIQIGSTTNESFVISNLGVNSINIFGIGCPYGFSSGWMGGIIPPGCSTNVAISFHPDILLTYGGVVTVYSDAAIGSDTVPVFGIATGNPAIGNANISVYAVPGPTTTSPSYLRFYNNLMSFLETSANLSQDRSMPANVTVPGIFDVGDLLASTNPVSLWRGQLNPPTPFQNENGNYLYFAVRIVSLTPFNLNGISWNYWDTPAKIAPYSGKLTNFLYSSIVAGLSYGPDGIKGTADDVLITSGSGTQLINELYYRGVEAASFFGNSPGQITNVFNFIVNNSPYYRNCMYSFTDTNGTILGTSTQSVLVALSLPLPPPTFNNFGFLQSGLFTVQVAGTPGVNYEVWASTNLFSWDYLLRFSPTNFSPMWIAPDSVKYQQRFYRLRTSTNTPNY